MSIANTQITYEDSLLEIIFNNFFDFVLTYPYAVIPIVILLIVLFYIDSKGFIKLSLVLISIVIVVFLICLFTDMINFSEKKSYDKTVESIDNISK